MYKRRRSLLHRKAAASDNKRRLLLASFTLTLDADDRLVGEVVYYDRATVLRQLGVFREPDTITGRVLTAINHPLTIARAFGRRIID